MTELPVFDELRSFLIFIDKVFSSSKIFCLINFLHTLSCFRVFIPEFESTLVSLNSPGNL